MNIFIVFDFDGLFSNKQFYFDNEYNYNSKDTYYIKNNKKL